MMIALLGLLSAVAALAVMSSTIIGIFRDKDIRLIAVLVRITVALALVSLSFWLQGSPAGVLGACTTGVLAGVLATCWSMSPRTRGHEDNRGTSSAP